ncbi:MAG: hypothetical protein VYC65_02895 [Chloroflexota bacterium]|nr:hypothetical protein [Chloroflexota bacterium]
MQQSVNKLNDSGLHDYLDKAIIWITLIALLLIPLIFSYFDITAVFNELKLLTLHLAAIMIVILSAWQILLVRLNSEVPKTNYSQWDLLKWADRNPARWALVGAFIWIMAQIAATLLSPLPVISFFGGDEGRSGYNLYDSLSLSVIFLSVAFRFRTIYYLKLLVFTLVITGTIAAIYGVAQHFGWDPIGGNLAIRVQASFGNTLNFGGYMAMSIPATLALVHIKRNSWWPLLLIIAVALGMQLAGMWFSGGRGPFVAGTISIITLLILTILIGSKRDTVRTLSLLVVSSIISAFIIALPSPKGDLETVSPLTYGLGRFTSIVDQFNNPITTSTNIEGGLAGRFNIWNSSLKLATHWDVPIEEQTVNSMLRPLFGLGPDMYVYSYPLIGQPSSWLRLVDHTHNYELQVLMEQGFIGLIGFMSLTIFLAMSVFAIVKRYRDKKSTFDATGIIILALLPAMIGKMFELQTGVARVSDLAMTLALFGAVIAIYELLNQQIAEGQNKSRNQGSLTSLTILPVQRRITVVTSMLAAAAITILVISIFISWDVRRLSASLILSSGHDDPNLTARAKTWDDAQAIAPERSSITYKLFEAYLAASKEQHNLGNTNEAMRLLMAGREMLLVYEQRDPLELDVQIGLSKTTSTLAEWGHNEYLDELTYRAQKLANIAPAYPTLLGTSATAMTSVGLHKLAIEYAERAIATEETTKPWSKAWYAKGRSLYEIGQEEEAIFALTTATEKEPGTEGAILAHKILGEIYHEHGNVELSEFHTTLGNADITVID